MFECDSRTQRERLQLARLLMKQGLTKSEAIKEARLSADFLAELEAQKKPLTVEQQNEKVAVEATQKASNEPKVSKWENIPTQKLNASKWNSELQKAIKPKQAKANIFEETREGLTHKENSKLVEVVYRFSGANGDKEERALVPQVIANELKEGGKLPNFKKNYLRTFNYIVKNGQGEELAEQARYIFSLSKKKIKKNYEALLVASIIKKKNRAGSLEKARERLEAFSRLVKKLGKAVSGSVYKLAFMAFSEAEEGTEETTNFSEWLENLSRSLSEARNPVAYLIKSSTNRKKRIATEA